MSWGFGSLNSGPKINPKRNASELPRLPYDFKSPNSKAPKIIQYIYIYPILSNIKWHYNWHYNLYNLLVLSREWMGCWGLLGVAGMIIASEPMEHSRNFPAFSTSKTSWWLRNIFFHMLGMSSSQLTFTPSFFRGVGENHQPEWHYNPYSYGPLPVISTYNPIYNMYNPTYNQL